MSIQALHIVHDIVVYMLQYNQQGQVTRSGVSELDTASILCGLGDVCIQRKNFLPPLGELWTTLPLMWEGPCLLERAASTYQILPRKSSRIIACEPHPRAEDV